MDFMEGVSPTDRGELKRLGLKPAAVATLIARTFAEMIFVHGFVHCDPHEANMLVKNVHGQPRLVLLDHGLYRQIDDVFRWEYAGLWKSLIFADEEGIKRHSESMNAGDMYPLFAAMLTAKPWDQITRKEANHLHLKGNEEERKVIQQYAMFYFDGITQLLHKVPREMLLLLKTNDCLRAVDSALGQPVNNYMVTARECSRALAERQEEQGLKGALRSLGVEWRILGLRLASLWMRPAQTSFQAASPD